ncbi:hypothetical protein E2320_004027, partial [Naja naja]
AVVTKAKVDFSGVLCLPPSVIAGNGLDGGGVGENEDETLSVSLLAAPSPQSEAVANELQELSLQPELTVGLHPGRNPNLPPLSERKNGCRQAKVDSLVSCACPFRHCWKWAGRRRVGENEDETLSVSLLAAPSPQSEAVANELQELSLQPELTVGLHPGGTQIFLLLVRGRMVSETIRLP